MPRPNNARGSSNNRRSNSSGKSFGKKDDSTRSSFKKSTPKKSFSRSVDSDSGSRSKDFEKPFKKKSFGDGDSKPRSSGGFRSEKSSSSRPFNKKSAGGRPYKSDSDSSSGRPFNKKSTGGRPYKSDSDGSSSRPFNKKSSSGRPYKSDSDSADRPFKKKSFGDKPYKSSSGSGARFKSDKSSEGSFRKKPSGDKPYRSDSDKPRFRTDKSSSDKPFRKSSSDSRGFKSGPDKFKESKSSDKPFKKKFSDDSAKPFRKKNSDDSSEKSPGERKTSSNYGLPFKRKRSEDADSDSPTRRIRSEASFKPGSKRVRKSDSEDSVPLQDQKIRLNRYIANSGVCSRREADELITMGLISVNGKTITELGYKVNPGDEVRHENKVLKAEKLVYLLLNKPKGYLTTTTDPQERNTVMQIIGGAVRERIYPVGRLDRNTTGLLLFTNDGDLAEKLMHPSYNIKKIYKVELDRPLSRADFEKITDGVHLEEGKAVVDDLAIVSEDGKTVGVEIHIGWNRVIRRIFEALEYSVVKLDRSVYAGLDKKELPRGHWRFLNKEEVVRLKHYK